MDLIIALIVQIALLVLGWKLWRWAKKRKKAAKSTWRRRFTALFFVSPMVLWCLAFVFSDNAVFQGIAFLSSNLDKAVLWAVGATQEGLKEAGAIGALAGVAKPIIHSIVYALLGALIGWPLDRMKSQADGEAGDEGEDSGEASEA